VAINNSVVNVTSIYVFRLNQQAPAHQRYHPILVTFW
jgi:hypothetical protein